MVQDPHITEARAIEIEKKLERLKKVVRPKLSEEVSVLAQGGDFSENAGYQSAKGKLRALNEKILNYEGELRRALIIKPNKQTNTVQLGHTVTVSTGGKQKTYQILGSRETNPQKGIISQNSPLGEKLIGRGAGDIVCLDVAGKEVEYKILQIK